MAEQNGNTLDRHAHLEELDTEGVAESVRYEKVMVTPLFILAKWNGFRILPCQSLTGVSSSLLLLQKKSLSVKRVVAASAFTQLED